MVMSFSPENIPLFPLTGALLLPRSRLPLNIFEPKYLEMIKDSLKSDHRLIGMIQPLENQERNSSSKDIEKFYKIGCAGKITSYDELDDGRYMITLTGFSRFFLIDLKQNQSSYLLAKIDWSDFSIDLENNPAKEMSGTDPFFSIIADYFSSNKISADWSNLKKADQETLINSLSILCPFESYEKQALLEAYSLDDRKKVLTTLMEISSQKQGNDIIQ